MTVRLFATFKSYDLGGSIGGSVNGNSYLLNPATYAIPFPVSSSVVRASGACEMLAQRLHQMEPGSTFVCYYDNSINRVVLSSSAILSSLQFNAVAQRVYGFSSSYSAVTVVTSSLPPSFVWTATHGRANDSDVYEETAHIEERFSDNGNPFGLGRATVAKFRDWTFLNEPKESVFGKYAPSDNPYSWERFVKDIRRSADYFVLTTNLSKSILSYDDREAVYLLHERSTAFEPKQLMPDYIEFWNLPIRCRVFDEKHRDEKEFPPGSVCQLPGDMSAVYPSNGSSFAEFPTHLSWSSEFNYGGDNPNVYSVFVSKDNPDFDAPIASTTDTEIDLTSSLSGAAGKWFWRVVANNQCGSNVSKAFTFDVTHDVDLMALSGAVFQRDSAATDLVPSIGLPEDFASKYAPNQIRRVDDKMYRISGSGFPVAKWYLFEGERTNYLRLTTNLSLHASWQQQGSQLWTSGGFEDPFREYNAWHIAASGVATDNRVFQVCQVEQSNVNTGSFMVSIRGPEVKSEFVPNGEGVWSLSRQLPTRRAGGSASVVARDIRDYQRNEINWVVTNTSSFVAIGPSLAWTANGSGFGGIPQGDRDAIYCCPQFELGTFPTSFIENPTDVSSSRAPDLYRAPSMPGSWHQGAQNRWICHFIPEGSSDEFVRQIQLDGESGWTLFDAGGSNTLYLTQSGGQPDIVTGKADSWQSVIGALSWSRGDSMAIELNNATSEIVFYKNGAIQGVDGYSGGWNPAFNQEMWIGSSHGTGSFYYGLVRFEVIGTGSYVYPTGSIEDELIAESIMWFDAAKGVTLNASNQVVSWMDQSPRGMHATASIATVAFGGSQYTGSFAGLNGEPVINTNNTTQLMLSGSMYDPATTEQDREATTFYVVQNDRTLTGSTATSAWLDIGAGGADQRRILFQQFGAQKRPGLFQVSGKNNGPAQADGVFWNTGSMAFSYFATGSSPNNNSNNTDARAFMFKNRHFWAKIINPWTTTTGSAWVNTGTPYTNASLFGYYSVFGNFVNANVSLVCAFSGSHNAAQRARVWDYLQSRFNVAPPLPPEYAMDGPGGPGTPFITASVVPSASIDARFWDAEFRFRFIAGTGITGSGTTELFRSSGTQRVILVGAARVVRWYNNIGTGFYTLGGLTGSMPGDEIEVWINPRIGQFGCFNHTQNVGATQWNTAAVHNWTPQDVSFLTGFVEGDGWQIFPPDLNYDGFET